MKRDKKGQNSCYITAACHSAMRDVTANDRQGTWKLRL